MAINNAYDTTNPMIGGRRVLSRPGDPIFAPSNIAPRRTNPFSQPGYKAPIVAPIATPTLVTPKVLAASSIPEAPYAGPLSPNFNYGDASPDENTSPVLPLPKAPDFNPQAINAVKGQQDSIANLNTQGRNERQQLIDRLGNINITGPAALALLPALFLVNKVLWLNRLSLNHKKQLKCIKPSLL